MKALSDYFIRKTRDDGTTFVTLSDDRPEWLHGAVMDAHDGEMPNDWRYDICESIVEQLEQYDARDWQDRAGPIADSLADVYNADLSRWLADDISRSQYVNEYVEDYGAPTDLFDSLRGGQYIAIERMAYILAEAIGENMDEQ